MIAWNRLLAAATLGATMLVASARGETWAERLFETREHDFGTVVVGAKAEFAFKLKNIFLPDVRVAGVRSSCGCSDVRIENAALKTYEEGAIVATANTRTLRGHQSSTITVIFDQPRDAEVQLHVRMFIRGDVVVDPPLISLGEVPQGESAQRETLVMTYGATRLTRAANPCACLELELLKEREWANRTDYRLRVRLRDDAPAGFLRETVLLTLNDRAQTKFPVVVEGRVRPEITVAPATLYFGTMQADESAIRQIVVRGQRPFRVTEISGDCDCFTFEAHDAAAEKTVHLIPVRFQAPGAEGAVKKKLRIHTDASDAAQEIEVFAVVLPKE